MNSHVKLFKVKDTFGNAEDAIVRFTIIFFKFSNFQILYKYFCAILFSIRLHYSRDVPYNQKQVYLWLQDGFTF